MAPDPCECPALACHHSQHRGRQTRLPARPHRTTERSRKLRPGQPQARKLAKIGGHGPRPQRVPSLSMSPHPAPRQIRLPAPTAPPKDRGNFGFGRHKQENSQGPGPCPPIPARAQPQHITTPSTEADRQDCQPAPSHKQENSQRSGAMAPDPCDCPALA